MALMPLTDAMFLIPETRDQPMHVGALQLFRVPADGGEDYLPNLYRELLQTEDIRWLFRRRAHRSPLTLGQWTWIEDDQFDLEHHLRHSALPRPGRIRELLALVSRLHGTLLDRQRPLWEAHLIEGLEDGRFAVYTKLHHAMMDGVSGLKLLASSLSEDPAERVPAPWAPRPDSGGKKRSGGGLLGAPGAALHAATDLAGLTPRLLRIADQSLREQAAALPLQAPRTILNGPITGARRFAAQSWPLDRVKAVATAGSGTVNDVVLAMCSAALRQYLLDLDALPDSPLIAMTPVSLRSEDDDSEAGDSGNAVGTILCSLGSDLEDPAERFETIKASMNSGKAAMSGLSQLQVTALSALIVSPLLVNTLLGLHRVTRPPFNIVISNIPGPTKPLYWNGAQLDDVYPMSIPVAGQALNITVTSYDGRLEFGLTGCRRQAPQLQRLLGHLDRGLDALAEAVGA
ncbi:MAG: wax ester/triacylglycerol synthase family O-acyltransferase [Actinomycetota bacterium]|nr:wax ester/triacylglycerol synthase family O-acyltransferase [Actinomycetota bacterium]